MIQTVIYERQGLPYNENIVHDELCQILIRILIGYYTVDCTLPKYIWTSAQTTTILEEPICESNMVKSSGHESKYISVLYSQLYNYLFYYISNCLKKMPLLNNILFLLFYHVNNKTLLKSGIFLKQLDI